MPIVLLAVALCITGLFMLITGALRPNLAPREPAYSQEEIDAVVAAREPQLSPDNPPVVVRDVDYEEGPDAPWYPKAQAPILDPLTESGKLEPAPERTGPEPVVLRGVEGPGKYGGTMLLNTESLQPIGNIEHMYSYAFLFRWSPQGPPLKPFIAKGYDVNEDMTEYTIYLRRGVRWSDGHPYTADDILYWYEKECVDPVLKDLLTWQSAVLKHVGGMGRVEKVDDYAVRFIFNKPHPRFLNGLASVQGRYLTSTPAHFLLPYHPTYGDPEKKKEAMDHFKLNKEISMYQRVKDAKNNPDHPRMWPWIQRTKQFNPPFEFVRNPYYPVVDEQGRQLPYFDRLLFVAKNQQLIPLAIANGEFTVAFELPFESYTLLMANRKQSDYEVYHWYPAERSRMVIEPNSTRAVHEDQPDTQWKAELLANKEFRKALSLALNRKAIIKTSLSGVGRPEQVAPGPHSPFYYPELNRSYVEFDPDRANALLDALGLTRRDGEGMRTFPDGSRMVFYLMADAFFRIKALEMVVADWNDVGVRTILQVRNRALINVKKAARDYDFTVYVSGEEEYLNDPKYYVSGGSSALAYDEWWRMGGKYDDLSNIPGNAVEPPPGSPRRKAMDLWKQFTTTPSKEIRIEIARSVLEIARENVWTINIATASPTLWAVKNHVHNVPKVGIKAFTFLPPGNGYMDTWWTEAPADTAKTVEAMREQIAIPYPGYYKTMNSGGLLGETVSGASARRLAWGLRILIWGSVLIVFVLIFRRYPYIARRLLIMIPTLLIISIVAFTIIQLPPGDYLSVKVESLRLTGNDVSQEQIEEFQEMFYLNDSMIERYARWLGLYWFASFDEADKGLLQGFLGWSMEKMEPVNKLVGERILLSFVISLGTLLFTWAVAIPIGIYSAVKQYSIGDYIVTFFGFLGMCIPNFLLAIIVMYAARQFFGVNVTGLFSAEFAGQPHWDGPKILDLLKHIWLPIVLLGVGGTASMIRVMRANLLDELKKPYVTTARAKGVRPLKMLFKYPVRLALNPFISGVGGIFPMLVSGGAILGIIMSLPTIGPLMLQSFQMQDMYMAGSMLMILSLLGVFGTLVSDLLLLVLDPRIRLEGGSK